VSIKKSSGLKDREASRAVVVWLAVDSAQMLSGTMLLVMGPGRGRDLTSDGGYQPKKQSGNDETSSRANFVSRT
jgi:hypothetical protein